MRNPRKKRARILIRGLRNGDGLELAPHEWRDMFHRAASAAIQLGRTEQQAKELFAALDHTLAQEVELKVKAVWRWAMSHDWPPRKQPSEPLMYLDNTAKTFDRIAGAIINGRA